ncbi:IS110 family transposase [Lentilactobacillus diolivorans]|uniref:IS110 family transposase n=1 Tax=Lentilactobacillus diolivorans TaxID=179838 RepID=UPI0027D9733E|nr:IS110 family transposase [Lentilactobacillus diolivorans]
MIALDVSEGHSYVVWYANGICQNEFQVLHTQSGFAKLLKLTLRAKHPVVYFEATGVYSRPVEHFCCENQLPYCRLNPLDLKLKTNGLRRLKTDSKDAHRIARAALSNHFRITQPRTLIYAKMCELTRFLDRIQADMHVKHVQLHAQLQQTFPELEQLFTSRVSKLALKVVSLFPHPDLVSGFSRTVLKNRLMHSTEKKLSKVKGLKYAEKLQKLAKDSYPAVSSDSVQVQAVRYYCHALIDLTVKKEHLIKQLVTLAHNLPEFDVLTSIPGIGAQSAAELIGELGNIRRFDNANQLNAFVGIDINRYQSGEYLRQDHINKRGDPRARMILYLIVKNMIRAQRLAPNHIVDYYYRLKNGPTPKRNKVALVACMNKTLYCLFSMVQANQKYDYTYHGLVVP